MPLYEYFCPPCNGQFEVLRPASSMDDPATCPSGHTTNNRVLSLFAPLARGESAVATMPQNPMMMGGGDSCCGGGCSCG